MLAKSSNLSLKLSTTTNDISKLNKRIGALEHECQSLTSELANETESRIKLENYSKSTTEAFSLKISTLKEGMASLSQTVSGELSDFKVNIAQEMANKSQALQDIVESKLTKIDYFDTQAVNSNHQFDSVQKETNKKLSTLEKCVTEQLMTYKKDLNTNLVHIEFIEKKLNDNYNIFKSDIANITKELIVIKNELMALKEFKNSSIEATQSMGNNIMKQEETMLQFTNRINLITNEMQNKMSSFENIFNNQSKNMNSLRQDIDAHLNSFDISLNGRIKDIFNELNSHKGEVCKEIESFEQHMISEQEKFTVFIQGHFEDHTVNIKKLVDYLNVDIMKLKENDQLLNKNVQSIKGDFFNNLNEVEEFLVRKYESLFKIISTDLNPKEYNSH